MNLEEKHFNLLGKSLIPILSTDDIHKNSAAYLGIYLLPVWDLLAQITTNNRCCKSEQFKVKMIDFRDVMTFSTIVYC